MRQLASTFAEDQCEAGAAIDTEDKSQAGVTEIWQLCEQLFREVHIFVKSIASNLGQ